ncbi:hypothetical protein [Mucilaginibacter glaciei]|uniref:DUF2911 family protein n=1 Tax=Mucilaginibacter glaciei TaxID=2772109 RepID=A0A926NSB9_9SPHI|nr:hypothetical protein [Mucilaginibacter glaciei]MBD1394443.1 hypothetical protein [Mucilaginibacter glaciei]
MRINRVLMCLLLPFQLLAQDTTAFKKQAMRYAVATFDGDHKTVIELTYPVLIDLSGGPELMQKLITDKIETLRKRGVTRFDGTVGSPGKFYKAGSQIHCLIPEYIIFKMPKGHYAGQSYLLGVSDDKGKKWKFLDVGSMPPNILHKLLPDFNNELVIPESPKPVYFDD